ncbi:transmembrane protein 185B-like [Mya arenaria]|uniref:transmembrane protein 185B-like n=1 Tax=Mya arenaria TaxID=6604 RepID=UPI0022E92F44|nr:transmembrane protein 185B-like [Mya arenaria]
MVNLQNLFQDFNPSKFVIFACLLIFSLLFSLRLDNTIQWSYWVVFTPIWIWKFLVISGSIVGSYVWFRYPRYRLEGDSFVQYKAMVITTSLHLMLLVFDILACDNLQTEAHSWMFVFIPLMFMSIVAIGFCVWAIKNERSFELELFCSVNILQFIFLALRLDNVIQWSWVIVFIPIWIVMCISMIGVIYAIILAILLSRSPEIIRDQRRGNLTMAIGYSLLVIPMLIFEVLLANRLDGDNHFKYSAITVPLFISLFTLTLLSFGAKGGNHWWFGIRKDFCQFLLRLCPCLQEYGNISYTSPQSSSDSVNTPEDSATPTKQKLKKVPIEDQQKVVMPIVSIDMPD